MLMPYLLRRMIWLVGVPLAALLRYLCKARLVTQLIVGRSVQDAMDILKFTRKRAATMVEKVLKSAVANADEQQADVDNLYVSSARVDDAGIRIGTKRWMPKDRGRTHPIRKKACHIYVTVTQV